MKIKSIESADINVIMETAIALPVLRTIEKKLDDLFAKVGLDIRFTKHFIDRINDERNIKPITAEELINTFVKTFRKYGNKLKAIRPHFEAVIADISNLLNIPFALVWDEKNNEIDLVVKTIMRKDNFHSPDPKLVVEKIFDLEYGLKVLENPTQRELLSFFYNRRNKGEDSKYGFLKGFITGDKTYWWDAYYGTHSEVSKLIGVEVPADSQLYLSIRPQVDPIAPSLSYDDHIAPNLINRPAIQRLLKNDAIKVYRVTDEYELNEYNMNARQLRWPTDSKAQMVIDMHPMDFLKLTTSDASLEQILSGALSKDEYQKFADEDKLSVHPFLSVEQKSGKVVSHEGRHRAAAAIKAGDVHFRVAIILYPSSRGWKLEEIPQVWTGQFDKSVSYPWKGRSEIIFNDLQKEYRKDMVGESGKSAVYKSEIPQEYKHLPVLGRGTTSIILDAGDKAIVVTRDRMKSEWLQSPQAGPLATELEVFYSDKHRGWSVPDYPIYVLEMPKLYPLDLNNKRKIKQEMQKLNSLPNEKVTPNMYLGRNVAMAKTFLEMYPDSILRPLLEFLINYDSKQFNWDLAIRNTLQDKTGKIHLIDPIVSPDLLTAVYN